LDIFDKRSSKTTICHSSLTDWESTLGFTEQGVPLAVCWFQIKDLIMRLQEMERQLRATRTTDFQEPETKQQRFEKTILLVPRFPTEDRRVKRIP